MTNGEFNDMVRRATPELRRKSLAEVQVETAYTWAARACAASHLRLTDDAIEYAHEAVEHAALSGHDDVLRFVRARLRLAGIPL